MYNSKQLNFIIGIGRSGTTLLSKLLNQHPQIHCAPESVFLSFFLNSWKNKKKFTEKEIELLFEQIKWYSFSRPWVGWSFDIEDVKQKTKDFVKDKIIFYPELCNFIYSHFKVNGLDKHQVDVLIDKNPSYTLFINKISATFKEAKFIYIVRDYHANVLSWKEHPDIKWREVPLNAWLWFFFNSKAIRFMKANKSKVLLIKYEDLVENSEIELKKIFIFLGVNKIVLDTNESLQYRDVNVDKFLIPKGQEKRFKKKYNDLNKPVNKDRLNVWKTLLDTEEIIICDSICEKLGKEFGYKSVYKKKSTFFYFISYLKTKKDILKEYLIYYVSPKIKLRRLKKVYTKLGFIQ